MINKSIDSKQEFKQYHKKIQQYEEYYENIIAEKKVSEKEIIDKLKQQSDTKNQELKDEISNHVTLLTSQIQSYNDKIIDFIKYFTTMLNKFIIWFENNKWDREKHKLNHTINSLLKPGTIIKIIYKNDNLEYQLQWSNFIFLRTQNNYHLVLAITNNETFNYQKMTNKDKKNFVNDLIEKKKYYFLHDNFCHLYTKFALEEHAFLTNKKINNILTKIDPLINEIDTIETETPESTNEKQIKIYKTKLDEIFQQVEKKYHILKEELDDILSKFKQNTGVINFDINETKTITLCELDASLDSSFKDLKLIVLFSLAYFNSSFNFFISSFETFIISSLSFISREKELTNSSVYMSVYCWILWIISSVGSLLSLTINQINIITNESDKEFSESKIRDVANRECIRIL
ncbi:hypothetical protein [Spiroplasma sp. AdecLV25b]|uniref:hypothetical protein n=1 Tax=Spiroplasma sp. AdecLV25b TaxID=3027162 RepID=UPI0027E1F2FD|nr:hypothetical protein [Spiroplasma sp. AdecLV25b]